MSRKEYYLIGLVVALVGIYAVFFTDWFRPKVMHIEHSTRSLREAWSGSRRVNLTGKQELGNVAFVLHRNYQLTSVKVVPAADYATNKYVRPLWELISKTGSKPVEGLTYGMPVPGMAPARPLLTPDPLVPGVMYKLIVDAGKVHGEHDFQLGGAGRSGS